VVVCRGRKTVEIPAADAKAKDLSGPTGNIRAPLVVAGDTLLVGFNQEALEELLA
jgi:arsenate reductase-like glutaredoxin family protein